MNDEQKTEAREFDEVCATSFCDACSEAFSHASAYVKVTKRNGATVVGVVVSSHLRTDCLALAVYAPYRRPRKPLAIGELSPIRQSMFFTIEFSDIATLEPATGEEAAAAVHDLITDVASKPGDVLPATPRGGCDDY